MIDEPDEGTLHEICWAVLLNHPDRPIRWIALEVAKQTAAACLGHPVRPLRDGQGKEKKRQPNP